jgi:hypothetical protein
MDVERMVTQDHSTPTYGTIQHQGGIRSSPVNPPSEVTPRVVVSIDVGDLRRKRLVVMVRSFAAAAERTGKVGIVTNITDRAVMTHELVKLPRIVALIVRRSI